MLNNERCPTCGMKKKRSSESNRMYWALLSLIAEQLLVGGKHKYTSNCWHVYFRQRYLGCEDIKLPNGMIVAMPNSTASLTNEEFGIYLDRIQAWCSEHGVVLPDREGNI